MSIQQYIDNLERHHRTGIAREHTYRRDLQTLVSELLPGVLVINEPARIDCGVPNYILTRKDISLGQNAAKEIRLDRESLVPERSYDQEVSSEEPHHFQ